MKNIIGYRCGFVLSIKMVGEIYWSMFMVVEFIFVIFMFVFYGFVGYIILIRRKLVGNVLSVVKFYYNIIDENF